MDTGLPSWLDSVNSVFTKRGVPSAIWESIATAESGLNPAAINTKDPGGSYGLFQLNRGGGQGAGYSPSALLDPVTNAKIAAPAIVRAYQQGASMGYTQTNLAIYTAMHSGHPLTAPRGQLLPPTWWPGYKAAKAEADNVASDYQKVTSPGGLAAQLGAAGYGVTLQPGENGIPSNFNAGDATFYPGTPSGGGSGAWSSVIKGLHKLEHPSLWNVTDPLYDMKAAATNWAMVILALLLIGFGLLAMLGIGVSDVAKVATKL